jgi:hypothetical protein
MPAFVAQHVDLSEAFHRHAHQRVDVDLLADVGPHRNHAGHTGRRSDSRIVHVGRHDRTAGIDEHAHHGQT